MQANESTSAAETAAAEAAEARRLVEDLKRQLKAKTEQVKVCVREKDSETLHHSESHLTAIVLCGTH